MTEPTTHSILRTPFDPVDPMDAMSEMFRRQVTDIALQAYKVTLYREMDTGQQFQCFVAGALTGLVGVCLASGKTEGADAIMEYIAECLPFARQQAEAVCDKDGNTLTNHHDVVGNVLKPIESAGMRGALKQSLDEHASMMPTADRGGERG